MAELHPIMCDYKHKYLPGCAGSIDVVHCKWAHCPAGDRVKAKEKEQFPSVAFECVTNNRRKILGIAPVQFGSRNDQHISERYARSGTKTLSGSALTFMVSSTNVEEFILSAMADT
ncbi:hypothetical protein ACHAXN_000722 [Cyclotella atomus]